MENTEFEKIECLFNTQEKIQLIQYLLRDLEESRTILVNFLICLSIMKYLEINFPDKLKVVEDLEGTLPEFMVPIDSLIGEDVKVDDSLTEILLRSTLPEVLKYRPAKLNISMGFWEPKDYYTRYKVLKEIEGNLLLDGKN